MKKINISAIILLLLFSACSKNIDLESDGIISDDKFYQSKADYEKALIGVYERLNIWGFEFWLEGTTDNAVVTHGWNRGFQLAKGTATPFAPFPKDKWKQGYVNVQRANTLIQNIDVYDWESNDELEDRNRILAETKTLRAHFYHDLVGLFGRPMKVQETPSDLGSIYDIEQAKNPKEIFDWILMDLEESIPYLKEYPDNSSYIGKAFGHGLRARIAASAAGYLRDDSYYDIVLSETDQALKLGYSLHPNYGELFQSNGEDLDGIILARTFSVEYQNGWGSWYPQSASGYSVVSPTKSLVDAYEYIDTRNEDLPFINKDPRFEASIYFPGSNYNKGYYNSIPDYVEVDGNGIAHFKEDSPYGHLRDKPVTQGDTFSEGGGGEWNKTPTGFNFKKYFDEPNTWNTFNSFVIMRIAEIKLLRAETLVITGRSESEAKSLVQEIRDRAGNTNNLDQALQTYYNGSLLELIRNEMRIEFANEGLRQYDLRRWQKWEDIMSKEVEGIEYKDYNTNEQKVYSVIPASERQIVADKYFWWPIPQSEIDISNGNIKQNDKW